MSDQTNQNRLHGACLRAVVHIPLQQRHRIHRLDWCWHNLHLNGLLWSRVAFSDESNYNLYFNVGQIRVYRLHGERYLYVNVKEHDHYTGGSVIYGQLSGCKDSLQFSSLPRSLNSQRYVDEVMRPTVLQFLRQIKQGTVFQDNNARLHPPRRLAHSYSYH